MATLTPNVEPTAEAIDDMAKTLQHAAVELTRVAQRLRSSQSLFVTGDAFTVVSNLIPNLRLDLLLQRPLRAVDAELLTQSRKETMVDGLTG